MESRKFLYDQRFDFEAYRGVPKKIVCFHFVPRSGSNLLADLIRQVGRVGFPLEYFSPANLQYLARRMPELAEYEFTRLVNCRTSPNGVFSYKWNSNFEGLDCSAAVTSQFRDACHVFIDRRDLAAQAKSYWDAMKTQTWLNQKGRELTVANIPATEADIRWAAHELEKVRQQTLGYLRRKETPYLTIMAEDIFSSPRETLVKIANFCSVDLTGVALPEQSQWTAPS